MATSGSKSVTVTSWDTLKFSWSLSDQSVDNNTSKVKWTLTLIAGTYGRISSTASKDWSVTVNGEKYSGTNKIGISNNSTLTLASGTTTIKHSDDGTKKFNYSFSQEFAITFSDSYIGTKSGSGNGTLTTIPRKSTLSVANGTLNTKQTLTVTRQSDSFTHTITYTCGNASGTICTKSTDTTLDFTPPLSLASQNTTGTSVSIKYAITTYNGNTNIGSNSYTKTCSIPSNVKPSCELSVEDASGHYSTYGAYIKGQSKFKVTVTPTLAYDSAIKSYSATANGVRYTSADFTTDVLTSSGALSISATVTDARGRSGTATATATVLDYSTARITLLKVKRCVSLTDGTEDIGGEFCQVTFSAVVSSLNDLNSASYLLEYKKTSQDDSEYQKIYLTDFKNVYEVAEGTYIFAADSGSSYDVRITVTDNITHDTQPTALSTGEVMEHWRADGKGMGFGKIGEVENGADFGWKIKPNKGFINILLPPETDINNVIAPNIYYGENAATYNYVHCPISEGTFTLEVRSAGNDGQLHQVLTVCSKTNPLKYERFYHSSATGEPLSWGEWLLIPTFAQLTRIFGAAYSLEITATKGTNYSSVEATAYIIGNSLRCSITATRTSAVNGDIVNEIVATLKINHGGKIKGCFNASFGNGATGGVASFCTTETTRDDTFVTTKVQLTAAGANLTTMSAFFVMPITLNLEAF